MPAAHRLQQIHETDQGDGNPDQRRHNRKRFLRRTSFSSTAGGGERKRLPLPFLASTSRAGTRRRFQVRPLDSGRGREIAEASQKPITGCDSVHVRSDGKSVVTDSWRRRSAHLESLNGVKPQVPVTEHPATPHRDRPPHLPTPPTRILEVALIASAARSWSDAHRPRAALRRPRDGPSYR